MEVSAKAGREKVDWAQRVHPDDYPQTDGKKYPSRVIVELAGERAAVWELPDDPADARGVLSHWAGVERGSYGYLMEAELPLNPVLRARPAARAHPDHPADCAARPAWRHCRLRHADGLLPDGADGDTGVLGYPSLGE
jgi:hypothetical protein